MPIDPCSADALDQTADLLAQGKQAETDVSPTEGAGQKVSDDAAWVRTAHKLGFFSSLRTQLGAWGDQFSARVIQPMQMMNIQAENFVTKGYQKYKDALAPLELDKNMWTKIKTGVFGIPQEVEEQLHKAVRLTNADGDFVGQPKSLPDHIVQTAKNIRKLYGQLGDEHGVDPDTFFQYRDLYYKRPTGVIRDPQGTPQDAQLRARIGAKEMGFYDELERKGIVGEADATATSDFLAYLHGVSNSTIRRPFFEDIEGRYVNDYLGKDLIQGPAGLQPVWRDRVAGQAWDELKSHVFGAPAPMDRILTYQFQKLGSLFGKEDLDVRSTYRASQAITSLFYSGTLGAPILGGRPGSVIRQLAQIVPAYADLGAKYTMIGMGKALGTDSIQALRDRNLLSSPIEQVLESVSVAKGAGRAIGAVTENSLKMFSLVDQYTRAATAYGKEAMFNDYMSKGILEKLPMRREIKDELLPLIKQEKLDEARDRFMFDGVSTLQYTYGKTNRPEAFRGALGSMAGIFMSYPLNTVEMLRMFVKDALPEGIGGGGNPVPLIRLMGLTATLLYGGSEMLDVDMRSAFATGALPTSMAFPKMAIDTFSAGKSNYDWLMGNLFMVGETDFHKMERQKANDAFVKNMGAFVPGGTFVFNDLPKSIDEGTLVRILGATPKAEALNEAARTRSKKRREETRAGGGQIRAISGVSE